MSVEFLGMSQRSTFDTCSAARGRVGLTAQIKDNHLAKIHIPSHPLSIPHRVFYPLVSLLSNSLSSYSLRAVPYGYIHNE